MVMGGIFMKKEGKKERGAKRVLGMILAFAMVITLLPMDALSVKAATQIGSSDVYWEFEQDTGLLTISGEGAMPLDIPWSSASDKIKSVQIGSGITTIANKAFEECSSLAEITIPFGVTSIGKFAFYGCSSLSRIVIPETVTNLGMAVFSDCTQLDTIIFKNSIPPDMEANGAGLLSEVSETGRIIVPEGVEAAYKSALGSSGVDFTKWIVKHQQWEPGTTTMDRIVLQNDNMTYDEAVDAVSLIPDYKPENNDLVVFGRSSENEYIGILWYAEKGYWRNGSSTPIPLSTLTNLPYRVFVIGKVMEPHDWIYSAADNKLQAECIREKGCIHKNLDLGVDERKASLTLSLAAPVYSGDEAVFDIGTPDERTKWEEAGLILPTAIKYYSGTQELAWAPTVAGTYTAKISPAGVEATDDNTASVEFTILKSKEDILKEFVTYKILKCEEATKLAKEDDSEASKRIIRDAQVDIYCLLFDDGKYLEDNMAIVDGIIAKMETDLAAQRAADAQPKVSPKPTASPKPTTSPKPTASPKINTKANSLALNAGLKVSQTGTKISVAWGKVKNVSGYEVYAGYCNKKKLKLVKQVKSAKTTSATITKLDGKKLNLTSEYKVYVKAYKMSGTKKLNAGQSLNAHVAGSKNKKYTNVKSIKLTKTSYKIKARKSITIKPKSVLANSKKKKLTTAHEKEFRYASSNTAIAKVAATGKITAVKKGTCYIYVYARNGYAKKIKITVS